MYALPDKTSTWRSPPGRRTGTHRDADLALSPRLGDRAGEARRLQRRSRVGAGNDLPAESIRSRVPWGALNATSWYIRAAAASGVRLLTSWSSTSVLTKSTAATCRKSTEARRTGTGNHRPQGCQGIFRCPAALATSDLPFSATYDTAGWRHDRDDASRVRPVSRREMMLARELPVGQKKRRRAVCG